MTSTEIRATKLNIESDQQAMVSIVEVLIEIAAQLAELNEREREAKSLTYLLNR
jgi:hypothetical protein